MCKSVVIEGRKVPLSRQAQMVASKINIGRDELGNLLAQCPRIIRQNGTLARVGVDDIRSIALGKESARAPQRYFIGKIIQLNLREEWYTKGCVLQLREHIGDTVFVLPPTEKKQPPFLGHPLRYSVTKVVVSEKEDGTFVVFVKFHGLRKATAEDLNPPAE